MYVVSIQIAFELESEAMIGRFNKYIYCTDVNREDHQLLLDELRKDACQLIGLQMTTYYSYKVNLKVDIRMIQMKGSQMIVEKELFFSAQPHGFHDGFAYPFLTCLCILGLGPLRNYGAHPPCLYATGRIPMSSYCQS